MAKRGGYPMGAMPGNMNNLMKQATRMRKQMEEQQEALNAQEFEGSAGGNAVAVKVNGAKEVLSVVIAREAVDPDDVEMLQDLVVAAANEALRKATEASEAQMQAISGGLNLPF